jgi:hypothetical protein
MLGAILWPQGIKILITALENSSVCQLNPSPVKLDAPASPQSPSSASVNAAVRSDVIPDEGHRCPKVAIALLSRRIGLFFQVVR